MNLNKEMFKKIFKIAFYILGSLSILFILVSLPFEYIPRSSEEISTEDSVNSSGVDTSYQYEDSYDEESRTGGTGEYLSEYIKTGQLELLVDDIDAAKESLDDIKNSYSGEYTYSYETGDGLERYVYLTLKIKSSDFEKVFEEISNIDGEVDYSYTDVTDVTQEYVDLQSRLDNAEAVETQLLEILQSAETVEDTLSVYTELASVRENIEVLKGQIRYLDSQTDYSYITVKFSLSSTGGDISEEEWKPLGVLKNALRALVVFGKAIVNMFIWILVFSPVGLVAWGIYWVANKKIRKTAK